MGYQFQTDLPCSNNIFITSKFFMNVFKKLTIVFSLVAMSLAGTAQKSVADIAAGSAKHSTLVAAFKAASLDVILSGQGPFTVFAPVNAAFDKLPQGTVATLLDPANKTLLTNILSYHVVVGNMDATTVLATIKAKNGRSSLVTVSGKKLVASMEAGNLTLTDEKGGKAIITTVDLKGSNGVIHVIDNVLMPGS
jgi:uncharacterized surface protein with fasciclin (FAS1) repeats